MFTTLTLSGLMLLTPGQAPKAGGGGGGGFGALGGAPGGGFGMVVAADTSPRIVELKPDAAGKIKITVTRSKQFKPPAMPGLPGGAFPAMMMPSAESVELADVKNLKITTTAGKEVKTEEAVKALAKGGYVLVSGDGKDIPTGILNLFNQDTLVLVSPELARNGFNGFVGGGGGVGGLGGNPLLPAPKGK